MERGGVEGKTLVGPRRASLEVGRQPGRLRGAALKLLRLAARRPEFLAAGSRRAFRHPAQEPQFGSARLRPSRRSPYHNPARQEPRPTGFIAPGQVQEEQGALPIPSPPFPCHRPFAGFYPSAWRPGCMTLVEATDAQAGQGNGGKGMVPPALSEQAAVLRRRSRSQARRGGSLAA